MKGLSAAWRGPGGGRGRQACTCARAWQVRRLACVECLVRGCSWLTPSSSSLGRAGRAGAGYQKALLATPSTQPAGPPPPGAPAMPLAVGQLAAHRAPEAGAWLQRPVPPAARCPVRLPSRAAAMPRGRLPSPLLGAGAATLKHRLPSAQQLPQQTAGGWVPAALAGAQQGCRRGQRRTGQLALPTA